MKSVPELHHVYYNDQWKALEERDADDTTVTVQEVCGIRSRNDLIPRDRGTTGNGTLNERLSVTTDAMFSGTSIVDKSGDVEERYGYSAFGKRRVMKADFDE